MMGARAQIVNRRMSAIIEFLFPFYLYLAVQISQNWWATYLSLGIILVKVVIEMNIIQCRQIQGSVINNNIGRLNKFKHQMDNNYKIISQIDDNNIPHIISVLEDINDHYESHEILIDHRDDNFNSGNQLLRRQQKQECRHASSQFQSNNQKQNIGQIQHHQPIQISKSVHQQELKLQNITNYSVTHTNYLCNQPEYHLIEQSHPQSLEEPQTQNYIQIKVNGNLSRLYKVQDIQQPSENEQQKEQQQIQKKRLMRKIKEQEHRLSKLKQKLESLQGSRQISRQYNKKYIKSQPSQQEATIYSAKKYMSYKKQVHSSNEVSPNAQQNQNQQKDKLGKIRLFGQFKEQLHLQKLTQEKQVQQDSVHVQQYLFQLNKEAYANYLKGVLLIKQILDPLEHEQLISYEDQKHIQCMFLIVTRARNYLKESIKAFKQKSKQSHQVQKDIQHQVHNICAYLEKCEIKFKIYSQLIDEIKDKLGLKISKLLHITKSVDGKQRFLDGFEGLDYTIQQQIQFTHRNYIEILLNSRQIKNQYFKNHRLKRVLRAYKKYCLINPNQINSEKQLRDKINQIIIDQ